MDGGAWWAIVHGVAKSQTLLSGFTFTFIWLSWASLVAQMVKNLPAMRETQGRSLDWEVTLEKEVKSLSRVRLFVTPWTVAP